jgi:hypothetical protein
MIRKYLTKRRLARSLRPDPQYRENRLAQFDRDRRNRYLINAKSVTCPQLAAAIDNARHVRLAAIKAMS